MASSPRIIVVGGGLAGLAAVIKIAEAGGHVDLFSIVPVKRSHSVCAQGGINAAKNLKGEGDTTAQHFDDTIYGGDFLANQTPVKAMCEAAPGIIAYEVLTAPSLILVHQHAALTTRSGALPAMHHAGQQILDRR